jgi:hypothetical protein
MFGHLIMSSNPGPALRSSANWLIRNGQQLRNAYVVVKNSSGRRGYGLLHTPQVSSLVSGLSADDRESLSDLSAQLARDPFPGGDSALRIEPFGPLPNTYTVPFGHGLLVYVVPPQKEIVGLVLVYQPLAVWGWGSNGGGELGDGTQQNRSLPVRAVGVASGRNIAVGTEHSLYVDDLTSSVWAWGGNDFSEVGDGTNSVRTTPVQLTGITNVSAVSAQGRSSMAVKNDGTVWT